MRIFELFHMTQAWSCWDLRLRAVGCHGDVVNLSSMKIPFTHSLSSHTGTMQARQGLHTACPLCLEHAPTQLSTRHTPFLPPSRPSPNITSSKKSTLTTPPKITTPTPRPDLFFSFTLITSFTLQPGCNP